MKSLYFKIIFLALLSFSSGNIYSQKNKLSMCDSTGTMPPFKYYYLDGTEFTSENISKKNTTIFIYFKNDCPYCNKEAAIVSENIEDLNSIDFIFISREDSTTIQNFAASHKLNDKANVKFLRDKDQVYYKYCTAQYTPSIHIYDKHKKLISYSQGTIKKEGLLKYVK